MELMEPSIPEDLRTGECHSEMWSAVVSDDLSTVRRLVNQWCRVDIAKGGLTLKDLALSRGTERIITLVLKMEPTLRFVNAVVENRADEVKLLFDKYGSEIDVNFPNMRHAHATALLFAIRHKQPAVVALLLERGARLDAPLILPDQSELPLLFHAIRWDLPPDLLRLLLTRAGAVSDGGQPLLDRMHYRGSWLLHWAVLTGLPADRLLLMLDYATPGVLCARNQKNQTFLDMAKPPLRTHVLQHKLATFDGSQANQILEYILRGFDLAWDLVPRSLLSPELLECATQLERHTYRFVCAVELGDSEAVQALTSFEFEPLGFKCCVANCRNLADGQPPLHKAVLNRDAAIVRHLCEVLLHGMGIRLDSIRDNLGRTALCYAYACAAEQLPTPEDELSTSSPSLSPLPPSPTRQHTAIAPANSPAVSIDTVANLLLDHGSAEFALDWADRTPQAFRDAASRPGMPALLRFHRSGDYRKPHLSEPAGVWIAVGRGGGGGGSGGGHVATCYSACCRNRHRRHRSGGGGGSGCGGGGGLSSAGDTSGREHSCHMRRHFGGAGDSSDCDSCDGSSADLEASNYTCGVL